MRTATPGKQVAPTPARPSTGSKGGRQVRLRGPLARALAPHPSDPGAQSHIPAFNDPLNAPRITRDSNS